ncbi:MAG: hypothetical protein V3S32_11870 [Acidimicrobiia bacterium]
MDMQVGRPAEMLEAAVEQGITVVAACVFPRLGGRVAHVAVQDDDVKKVTAIVEAGGGVVADVRDCVVVPPDFSGGLPAAAKAAAEAGHMVNVSYYGAQGEFIMASPDPIALRQALDLMK